MSEKVIRAIERKEKPKQARRNGYAPGVIYGRDLAGSIPVKFEMNKLRKELKQNNQTISVKINDDVKDCIVKEVQFDCITGEILHVDLQTVSKDSYVKLKVPVYYSGKEKLESKGLLLQVLMTEVEVKGKVESIPESITIDVDNKELGDKILLKDLNVDKQVKILEESDSVLAVIISKDSKDSADNEDSKVMAS